VLFSHRCVGTVKQLFKVITITIKHLAIYKERIRHSNSWDLKLVKFSNYSTGQSGHVDTKTEILNRMLMEHL
jgi:hypothetical protein